MIYGILACDMDGGVGLKQGLPWPMLKGDMDRFRRLTDGHIVVMGRKTYETLKAPLKNRLNVVISRNPDPYPNKYNNVIYTSAETFIDFLLSIDEEKEKEKDSEMDKNVYIIGGPEIWKLMSPYIHIFYVTHVMTRFKCDTYMDMGALKRLFPYVLMESKMHRDPKTGIFYTFEARTS